MDPITIATTSIAIAKLSAQCIVALTTWVGEVKTADERIEGFCAEIENQSSTLDALNGCLDRPEFNVLDKDESDTSINANASSWESLCAQLKVSLDYYEKTTEQLRTTLEGLKTGFGTAWKIFRRPIKQFRESLEAGQISILRERILFSLRASG
jgi:hypothetical protein